MTCRNTARLAATMTPVGLSSDTKMFGATPAPYAQKPEMATEK